MKVEVKEIKPVEPPKEYVLTLNQNEMDLLVRVFGRIGGAGPWKPIVFHIYEKTHTYGRVCMEQSMLDAHGDLYNKPEVFPK
jgi:hypothetical protein